MRGRGSPHVVGAVLALSAGAGGACADSVLYLYDGAGDAVARRTDSDADAMLAMGGTLPDLISVRLRGAYLEGPPPPTSTPDHGRTNDPPDILEIRLKFDGLVNPPGPLGFVGLGYDANRYGPSPLYGFLEIDIDGDRDTGGELSPAATFRYLANVGRFGKLPANSLSERAIRRPKDLDADFFSLPYFERSGAEFALALCACSEVTVVCESGDMDGTFDPGEEWVVSGRFFKRAEAFRAISGMGSAPGGGPSEPGLYDPIVELTFRHDEWDNETTVEMCFPLTPEGAANLLGGPPQGLDFAFGGQNHYSMAEAIFDLIFGASKPPIGTPSEVITLAGKWADADPFAGPYADLEPQGWKVTALFGSAAASADNDPFVWTDTGFGELFGDVNVDGVVDSSDAQAIHDEHELGDGGPDDAGPADDGKLTIGDFGPEFSLYDLRYDGSVEECDITLIFPCAADLAAPPCELDYSDAIAFLNAFGTSSPIADFAAPFGILDYSDVLAFLIEFTRGCPSY